VTGPGELDLELPDPEPDSGAALGAEEAGAGSGAEAGPDIETGPGAETGTRPDAEAGPGAEAASRRNAESGAVTGAQAEVRAGPVAQSGSEAGMGSEARTGAGLHAKAAAEADPEAAAGTWPGPEAGSDAEAERRARAALSVLADPGDATLGALLRAWPAREILAVVSHPAGGAAALRSGAGDPAGRLSARRLDRAIARWRARLGLLPTPAQLADREGDDLRMICPGDTEWPSQLDDLGDRQPAVLWVQGRADLRFACLRSVALVGSRAATAYGTHVAGELGFGLAERGVTVVSGGAYGIDSAAHRGALAADGVTVAVLASGLSYGYPRGHQGLFAAITDQGALISECPPDRAPTRPGFLIRNRIIAVLSRGTVVVEAAVRSGALSTARHARELRRPLMAVPGPVTSQQSAGCHELLREGSALCVTDVRDVLDHVSPVGTDAADRRHGPAVPRDQLDPVTTAVLEAIPARGGRGPATIAITAGVDLDTTLRCLGLLAAAGFVQRAETGWRLRKGERGRERTVVTGGADADGGLDADGAGDRGEAEGDTGDDDTEEEKDG
jgi:DNA processing protein